ncbi:MAG: hypothetical protein KTR32_12765, partial [Granulosicoccus sp.]|nr:hypothetical protein [Granulosicoccus sp.]
MTSDIKSHAFLKSGRTWTVLILAGIAWLAVSLWSFRVAGFELKSVMQNTPSSSVAQVESGETTGSDNENQLALLDQNENDKSQQEATQMTEDPALPIPETDTAPQSENDASPPKAEDQARLDVEAQAREQTRLEEQA